MKIENGKILAATEPELYSYWLSRDYDMIYSFSEFKQKMLEAGVQIGGEYEVQKEADSR